MTKQVVIRTSSGKVLRWGFCDFQNDGTFDSDKEQVVEKDCFFTPDIDEQDWFWNGMNFQSTEP